MRPNICLIEKRGNNHFLTFLEVGAIYFYVYLHIMNPLVLKTLIYETLLYQGSYRQVAVKFKDFSRTSKRFFLLFLRNENL